MQAPPNIKGFLETSFLDWRGKVSSVIFLGGCNFRCPFCHNAQLVLSPGSMEDISWPSILKSLRSLAGWIDGVCFTGGEPTLNPHLGGMMEDVRSIGLMVKLDTNGSRPSVLEDLLSEGLLDAVSMDVKSPLRQEAYQRCCGVRVDIGAIKRSIRLLCEANIEVEFRTTFVPVLISEEEILEIASFLPAGVPYRVQGFRAKGTLDPYMESIPSVDEARLRSIQKRVLSATAQKEASTPRRASRPAMGVSPSPYLP